MKQEDFGRTVPCPSARRPMAGFQLHVPAPFSAGKPPSVEEAAAANALLARRLAQALDYRLRALRAAGTRTTAALAQRELDALWAANGVLGGSRGGKGAGISRGPYKIGQAVDGPPDAPGTPPMDAPA